MPTALPTRPPHPARRLLVPSALALLAGAAAALAPAGGGDAPSGLAEVRGVTISCQTWGWEWGTEGFGRELDELAALGANWVAIHPYARIGADGSVGWRPFDPADPPAWLRGPIEEAHRRGFGLLVKPHLAYWGSPFRWRGEIRFEDPLELARFFEGYGDWVEALARATRGADAFAVGTELDATVADDAAWRAVIARVRAATDARLTYAANWDTWTQVGFWDALDAIGVQAYFPLSEEPDPDEAALRAGWERALVPLRAASERTGKPVVFTELGYNESFDAARAPYDHEQAPRAERDAARVLQARCTKVALEVLARERTWLRGAFLWKWFVGEVGHHDANFLVDTPTMRAVLAEVWSPRRAQAPAPGAR